MLEAWSQQEEAISREQREISRRAEYEEEINPSRSAFHKFIVLVKMVAGIAALNMFIGQVIGIFFQEDGPIQYVLRFYVMLLCGLAILVELEWTRYARESKILQNWITRGSYYGFIGVIGLEENDTSRDKNTGKEGFDMSHNYLRVVAWTMIYVGIVYFLLGIFCCQLYYNRRREDYERRLGRAAEVQQTAERYGDTSSTV